jgi:hypothetical protein
VATLYLENTESELQISLSVFMDDLERRFKQIEGVSLFLGDPKLERENCNELIEEYLRETFILRADDAVLEWRLLGKEVEYDVCWIYMEAKALSVENSINVDLQLLFDIYGDQTNVINWKEDDLEERKIQRPDGPVVKFNRP